MSPLLRRREYKKLKVEGTFVLILDPDMPKEAVTWPNDLDGPFDPDDAVTEPDGTIVLLSEGMPYLMRIIEQDGNRLTFETGQTVRIEPWPLSI